MATFYYTAKNKDAQTVKGQEDAGSAKEFISRLRGRGLFVISFQQGQMGGAKPLSPKISGGKRARVKMNRIKLQDFAFLARNLSTLLSSGVTLLHSLNLVAYQTESLKLAKILNKCSEQIRGGLSFEETIKKYSNVFPSLWAGIVKVGEASGNLPFVLSRLADYLEIRIDFERKIKSALIYPVILIAVAIIAVFVFIRFIFPQFQDIFQQFDVELPLMTQIILDLAGFLQKYFFWLLGLFVTAIVALNHLRRNPEVKKNLDRFILKLPLAGDVVFLTCVERFTSILHILLESGLPLVYSLEVTSKSIGNFALEQRLFFIIGKVKEGASLSDELTKAEIFPILVSEMAKIGEETGSMPDVFSKVSEHYRKELTTKIDRMVAAFEPLMVIFMGFVIGAIVISLFLPMFQMAAL